MKENFEALGIDREKMLSIKLDLNKVSEENQKPKEERKSTLSAQAFHVLGGNSFFLDSLLLAISDQ